MKTLPRITLAMIAAVSFAWLGAACNGGGGASSLEDYFKDYEQLDNKAEDATADLQREFDAALSATTLDADVRADLQEYYSRQIEIRQDYVEDIAKLEPPESARAAHDASVNSYEAVLAAFNDIVDDIGEAQTTDDLTTIFSGDALTAAVDAATKACVDLQEVADDNNVNINLECE